MDGFENIHLSWSGVETTIPIGIQWMLSRWRPYGDVVAMYLVPSSYHSGNERHLTVTWLTFALQSHGRHLTDTFLPFPLWWPLGSKDTATLSPSLFHLSNISMCADRKQKFELFCCFHSVKECCAAYPRLKKNMTIDDARH
jgi:hypothetical protein